MQDVYAYVDSHAEEMVEELRALLRQPSISAHNVGLDEGARLLQDLMDQNGFSTTLMKTSGGPDVVFGTVEHPSASRTLLCYGHYDVQPPEPLDEWHSPPFDAEIRDGVVYARGACDNKSGVMAFVHAARAYRETHGSLPVNLTFCFEGEEEIGSPHFLDFVERNAEILACDGSIGLDGGVEPATERPTVQLGVKGILYVELIVREAKTDAWSGFAQMIPSAAWRAVKLLNSLVDVDTGHIKVDGWYDDLVPLEPEDQEYLAEELALWDPEAFKRQFGISHFAWDRSPEVALREKHYGASCNICGFSSGYAGQGTKTIIPSEARIKLDFRCPPKLEPERQLEKLRSHLADNGFSDVELIVHTTRGNPYKVSGKDPLARATRLAALEVFGCEPIVYGVSIQGLLMVHVPHAAVLSGFGAPDNNLHAPNENMPVDRYIQGVKYAATIFHNYGATA
jgi:acetylornithine deacetylase/succinyl-diaminopimelate desuccinylase-like protein